MVVFQHGVPEVIVQQSRVRGHSFFSISLFNELGTVRLQPVVHNALEIGIISTETT